MPGLVSCSAGRAGFPAPAQSFRRQLGQPEVEDLGLPAPGDEDVGRLDVPVNDPFGVRGLQTVGHLERHREDLVHPQPLPEDALLQRLALEQLHRNEVLPLMLVDVVDGADVRMIQGGGRLGLPLESLQRMAVLGQLFGQELQGDGALEPGVLGLVDDTHAAAAELLQDPVVRYGLADAGAAAFGSESTLPLIKEDIPATDRCQEIEIWEIWVEPARRIEPTAAPPRIGDLQPGQPLPVHSWSIGRRGTDRVHKCL